MNIRSTISAILAFLGGAYFFLHFVLPNKIGGFDWKIWHSEISDGFLVVGTMTVGLGLLNLISSHGRKFLAQRQGWLNSFVLLFSLFLMLFVSAWNWKEDRVLANRFQNFMMLDRFAEKIISEQEQGVETKVPFLKRVDLLVLDAKKNLEELKITDLNNSKNSNTSSLDPELIKHFNIAIISLNNTIDKLRSSCVSSDNCKEALVTYRKESQFFLIPLRAMHENLASRSFAKNIYRILYDGFFVALGSSIFSLLGFYIVAAAFKAFRVRTLESAVMMLAALIVMLGQISIGYFLWSDLPELRLWILQIPNAAAFRAIAIGSGVASLVLGIRMWFSLQPKSFKKE